MKILILGYGKVGQALHKFLEKSNNQIYIYDQKDLSNELENYYSYEELLKSMPLFDLVIRSPGISILSKVYQLAKLLSKEIKSELDFASKYLKTKHIIGITGSNGKTTTSLMLKTILEKKYRVFLVGNIGIPLIEVVNKINSDDVVIIEVSSFMLEDTSDIIFESIIFTTLSPNHIDQCGNIYNYYISKKRIFFNRVQNLICNDEILKLLKLKFQTIGVNHYHLYNSIINNINFDNAMSLGEIYGVSFNEVVDDMIKFNQIKYRQEIIYQNQDIIIVNDSKSTSTEATNYCIKQFENQRIILILNGIFKSENISEFALDKVYKIYSYGKISSLLPNFVIKKDSLEDILLEIKGNEKNVVILFSPGGSSFDLYHSYIERGEHFTNLVNKIWKIN